MHDTSKIHLFNRTFYIGVLHYIILANKLALMELETALSPQKTFLIGAFANAIATLITYPVQVVQAKMRVSTYYDIYKYIFQMS